MENRPDNGPDFRTEAADTQLGKCAVPVRTCVVCRQKAARSQMWRLQALASELVPETECLGKNLQGEAICLDLPARGSGRGAWVHSECLSKLRQKHLYSAWPRRNKSRVKPANK